MSRFVWITIATLLSIAAQAQNLAGGLRGTVEDDRGAHVASAVVKVRMAARPVQRTVHCDGQGDFLLQDLTPGIYHVTVTSPGFASAVADVSVEMSTIRDVTVKLHPETIHQSVNVRAQNSSVTTQAINLSSQVQQAIVSSGDLGTFPLPARSFANIAYLAPGTEPVEPSDPTKARITAVSTGGSSGLNNELSVDGADNSDDYIGGFLQNFSPDSIQEFAIRTSQEDADIGGTTAGSFMLSTKSGNDDWHGGASFYDRAAALNARFPIENPVPNPKQPFSRQNYVATIGGPIRRDKLFWFSTFDSVHEDASVAYTSANVEQFQALASLASKGLIPEVISISVPTTVPIPFRDFFGMERMDWIQSSKSQWYVRASGDSYTTHNNLVQQGTLPSTGLLTHNNYLSLVVADEHDFSPSIVGRALVNAGSLHLTQSRNSNLGFALAFPFSSTSLTVSGFETFGDNQFATPITYFPSKRDQEKFQFRYDLTAGYRHHAITVGTNVTHEPVLGGAFAANTETLYQFPQDPTNYLGNPSQFTADMIAGASTSNLGGGFSQNIQRIAFYGQDAWRAVRPLTLTYGIRCSTTYGLFQSSGRNQTQNPGYITLQALDIPLVSGIPHDDHQQFGPTLGFAYSPGTHGTNVVRGGFSLHFNDLAQNGWATAFQAVDKAPGPCFDPIISGSSAKNAGCVAGAFSGGTANLIDPHYRTPYAIHVSGGMQHAINSDWSVSADFVHEQGNHAFRAYSYTAGENLFTPLLPSADSANQTAVVPNVNVYHADNRSSYNGLLVHLQGNANHTLSLVANFTLSKAQTWGCVLGELFDYVNGVCNPLDAFEPRDYGPSGEDVRERFVLAGEWHAAGGLEVSGLTQAESARPFTITTEDSRKRISIDGVPTVLDQFRGTPYTQTDLRVSRTWRLDATWKVMPFAEFFNLFNRNNPGANYVTNIGSLPVPAAEAATGNVTDICEDVTCSVKKPIKSTSQLRVAGGALGDFFGPGTTVGTPFAAQVGVRIEF